MANNKFYENLNARGMELRQTGACEEDALNGADETKQSAETSSSVPETVPVQKADDSLPELDPFEGKFGDTEEHSSDEPDNIQEDHGQTVEESLPDLDGVSVDLGDDFGSGSEEKPDEFVEGINDSADVDSVANDQGSLPDLSEVKGDDFMIAEELKLDEIPGEKPTEQQHEEPQPQQGEPQPRRRGRPKASDIHRPDTAPAPAEDAIQAARANYTQNSNANEILSFVCTKTLISLAKIHHSEMFTPTFTDKLIQGYIDGKITAGNNQMFKSLIQEMMDAELRDPYMEQYTASILGLIIEG